MPSFSDSIFLFILALLLFGPKKLPVLARELGKWVGEFRRASNEFKMQMEEELRASEQADRQKQIAAMEAAAPLPPPLEEPHPHLDTPIPEPAFSTLAAAATADVPASDPTPPARHTDTPATPVPIAISGELKIMPPSTGLPAPRSRSGSALGSFVDSIPAASETETTSVGSAEGAAHGH